MLNLGQLTHSVQKNCHISDAKFAGEYTLCVFLLKMREFYRWENSIPFADSLPNEDVGDWMQQRERMWENLESCAFDPLPLERGAIDPFDTAAINEELLPRGIVYSGGYGRYNKPLFFLGELIRVERRGEYTVYVSSCEYARDLVAPPAMFQGKNIYIRQESVHRFIWEKIEEWGWTRKNKAMGRALASYSYEQDKAAALDRMTRNESETMILHELGEGMAGNILGEEWHRMLLALSRTKAEIMARAARDLLADCLSTLPGLIESENIPALHFYFANFTGMRRHLFPGAMDTYNRWDGSNHLEPLQELVSSGSKRWQQAARTVIDLYNNKGGDAVTDIERFLEQAPA